MNKALDIAFGVFIGLCMLAWVAIWVVTLT